MRVVLDTNVLISAVLSQLGAPWECLAGWRARHYELVISLTLFTELARVSARPRIQARIVDPDFRDNLIADLETDATFVEPEQRLTVVRDEADNRVLEAAVAGEVDYVVSGDADLLSLRVYEGIEIVTPARFAAILASADL